MVISITCRDCGEVHSASPALVYGPREPERPDPAELAPVDRLLAEREQRD